MSTHKLKGLKGNGYQARWTDPAGSRRAKNFKTKAEAQRYEAEMTTAVRRGEYSDPQAGKAKLSSVYENWKASSVGLKPKTKAPMTPCGLAWLSQFGEIAQSLELADQQ